MRYNLYINFLISVSAVFFLPPVANAEPSGSRSWGFELQIYPTGIIPGLRYEWMTSRQDQLFARLAYNFTDRSDFGEHDDESGGGPGIGFGWRHWQNQMGTEWHYGGRIDVWDMEIDWEEDGSPDTEGETDILVVQPSGELGYSWKRPDGSRIDLNAGLGVEVNVHTDGEDVGEGVIVLGGFTWMFP